MKNTISRKYLLILLTFAAGVLLMFVKFAAWYLTSSYAILTDALESIVNVVASGFALYSVYLASKPKDENHPYGHGKIEFFSAGIEGVLIILAGFYIIFESVQHLIETHPLQNLNLGLWLVMSTTLVNFGLGWYLQQEGKRSSSLTILAEGKHLMVDAQSSALLLVGVGIVYFTQLYWLDSALSLCFALWIIYNGLKLVRTSVSGLMDEVDAETLDQVVGILKEHQKVFWIDIHNLRIQKYGSDLHIDCHLTLPFYWNLEQVHEVVHNVEEILERNLNGDVEIFIHADPCLPACCHHCQIKNCDVRKFNATKHIEWTSKNLALNQKHFLDMLIDD